MTAPSSLIDCIAQVPCFTGLESVVLERLAAHCRIRLLSSGEVIARRGQSQSHLVIVRSGALELSLHSREGKRHVLTYLKSGELFGLVPALDGREVIHDAMARGTSEVLQIPHDALLAVAQDHSALLMRFLELMCQRFRHLYQNYTFRQLLPLHERVVLLLMELVLLEPQVPLSRRGPIAIHMTQADMSDMLCVSRQSLSAELKKLEKNSLIQIGYPGLTIIEPLSLERYANGLL